MIRCPYGILGVSREATDETIKDAWRDIVFKCHPDVSNEATIDKFLEIQWAYEFLTDPIKRKKYDETGEIDDRELELEEAAKENIVSLLKALIYEDARVLKDPREVNLVELMAKRIRAEIKNTDLEKSSLIVMKEKLREIRERFYNRNNGSNIIDEALEKEISTIESKQNDNGVRKALFEKMLSIVENYSYML